jgi:MATE family multidrug resistance protein
MGAPAESLRVGPQLSQTCRLAIPLAIGQIGQMTMILIDMYMVGKLGPAAISGVGLGGAFFYVFGLFGAGTLFGLDYFVSQAQGREARDECHHWLWQGTYLALIISLPLVAGIALGLPPLLLALFPAQIAQPAVSFLKTLALSLPPFLIFITFRQYLQAMGSVRPGTVVTVLAIFTNVAFNRLFIFGAGPVSPMGVAGAGLATTLTRIFMAVALVGYTFYRDAQKDLGLAGSPKGLQGADVRRLFMLGAPTGLQLSLETGVFSLATSMISKFGVTAAASHTIVSNISGFTYTVPMALSGATAILVGQSMGGGQGQRARFAGWTSIGLAAAVMAVIGGALSLFGSAVAGVFTEDTQVIQLSSRLILLVALFQVADGVQSVGGGAMRGLGDTQSSMVANLLGYWVIGLPLGYFCCFHLQLGALGFWIGLTTGLFAIAGIVLVRWSRLSRAPNL